MAVNINIHRAAMSSAYENVKPYIEGACLHADDKPLEVAVGSIMTEVDTGDVYFFSGTTWVKQFSFQD